MKYQISMWALLVVWGGLLQVSYPQAIASPPAKSASASTAGKYAGHYYCGDHLGYNLDLVMKADGTYSGTWRGCMGVYGTAKGKWQVARRQIILHPANETGLMKGHLSVFDIVKYKNTHGLLPVKYRKPFAQGGPSYADSFLLLKQK
jgi:hypothetical protein